MFSILQKVILNNTVESYVICFGTILVALLLKRYLSKYVAGLLFAIIKRTSWQFDKKVFVDLLVKPLSIFLFLLITIIALDKLHYPSMLEFDVYHKMPFRTIVDSLGRAIMVISFIWLCLRSVDFIAFLLEQKANITADLTDNQLVVFFRDFFKVIIFIAGVLMLLAFSLNKDVGTLLAGFGIVGAALALAARESLENLIASFIIFFDKPFFIGDLVKVQGIIGTVEKIGLRSTRIRTDQKTFVTVPNKQMVDSIMDNLSLRSQRRADLRLEISLSTPAVAIQEVIPAIRAILQHPSIENSNVFFADILGNAFVIVVEYYTAPIAVLSFNELKQTVNIEVLKLLSQKGIELAGLNTEIVIKGSTQAE